MMTKDEFSQRISGGLIVSCQALPGEPLYREEGGIMALMAQAAMEAGAVGIRANGVQDIRQIMAAVNLPVIGLIKRHYPGFSAYITPTLREVDALAEIGCPVIALDCTRLTRPGDLSAPELIRKVRETHPQQMLMADCATLEDALEAAEAGVDFVGTTMNGYVPGTIAEGPAFELAKQIVAEVPVPLIAEGRIHHPAQARQMLELGALAVVVGGAITRPKEITQRFLEEISKIHHA